MVGLFRCLCVWGVGSVVSVRRLECGVRGKVVGCGVWQHELEAGERLSTVWGSVVPCGLDQGRLVLCAVGCDVNMGVWCNVGVPVG